MESLIPVLVEIVKVTFIWREYQHFVRNCQIQCTDRCELLLSSGPPSSEDGHVSCSAHSHTCTNTFMHGWPHRSTRTWNIQHPHRQPHPIPPLLLIRREVWEWTAGPWVPPPRYWPMAMPNNKVHCPTPIASTQTSFTTTHKLVQTKCLPSSWSLDP